MNQKPKKISPKILCDTGLLFEINRRVLHPLGLALEVIIDNQTDDVKMGQVWDYRDDPEGLLFGDKEFAVGMAKLRKFMDESGKEKLKSRVSKLGFIVQHEKY